MVYEFLIKYQEELITKKMERNEDYELVLSKIRENEKFLELLEKEESNVFSDFTPREVNYKNADRISEIKVALLQFEDDKFHLEKEIKMIDNRLDELSSIVEEVKQPKNTIIPNKDNNKKMKHDLTNILSYITQDTERAKIELKNFIDKL